MVNECLEKQLPTLKVTYNDPALPKVAEFGELHPTFKSSIINTLKKMKKNVLVG